ncbi:uncharacterized protein LOC133202468 [Saccostrea echinata]|uniref:uncharacterized protein LOC133202468 n=1 Tax=Saccostrea echinata TaxID=191078 RepID=UPI002A7FD58D|nr:uncharacterized protein LOC133202468 [Saccostrea echinata]
MLFPRKFIFFFSCVLRFVSVHGNFKFLNSRRFLDQPSFLSTRPNRALRRGPLVDSDFRLGRTFTSLSPWREVNQRNYFGISPRTSGRSLRNNWSSSTLVNRRRPLFAIQENRLRRGNGNDLQGHQSGKSSKEVLNNPMKNINQVRLAERSGRGTIKSRRIENLLKLMSQNQRADFLNLLKGGIGKKTSAERMPSAVSRLSPVSSRNDFLRKKSSLVQLRGFKSLDLVEEKKTSAEKISEPKRELKLSKAVITRPKQVLNQNLFLRVRNTPIKRTRTPHFLPLERNNIVTEKKKTSAEKISKSEQRTKLSNINDTQANQKILLLQRLNTYLRQQLASRKHTNSKQTNKQLKKASETSKEIMKDNNIRHATTPRVVNAPRKQEPLLSLTQRPHRRSQLLLEPMRFNPHRRRLPLQGIMRSSQGVPSEKVIEANTVDSPKKANVSPQKPLFVLLNPFTGTVGSSTSSIQDKNKNTSKEDKSGEKFMWVNP